MRYVKSLATVLFVSLVVAVTVIFVVVLPQRPSLPVAPTPTATTLAPTPTTAVPPTATPTPTMECVVGIAYFESPEWAGLLIQVGETSICGEGLRISDLVIGPDYDSYITDLENELARWRDCVRDGLCRDDMRRSTK